MSNKSLKKRGEENTHDSLILLLPCDKFKIRFFDSIKGRRSKGGAIQETKEVLSTKIGGDLSFLEKKIVVDKFDGDKIRGHW